MDAASHGLTRALATNSDNVVYDDPRIRDAEPVVDTFVAGLGGVRTHQQLLLVPFGDGGGGATFLMRLYGWYHIGPPHDANKVLWLPLVLAELKVSLGNLNGFEGRQVAAHERFAGAITLQTGSLGYYGSIVNGPIAWVKVDLKGCRKFSFDFAQVAGGVLMNTLWAPASAF